MRGFLRKAQTDILHKHHSWIQQEVYVFLSVVMDYSTLGNEYSDV